MWKRRSRVLVLLGPLQMIAGGGPMPLGAPRSSGRCWPCWCSTANRPVSVDSLINAVWDQLPVPAGTRRSNHPCSAALAEWRGPVLDGPSRLRLRPTRMPPPLFGGQSGGPQPRLAEAEIRVRTRRRR